jgi:hypothetical protein
VSLQVDDVQTSSASKRRVTSGVRRLRTATFFLHCSSSFTSFSTAEVSMNRRRQKTDGFELVRQFGLSLPDVEESTMYGAPALKVRGRMFACMASHKSAEPGTLVVRIEFSARDELIATEPAIYYLKDHYVDYASVLVRLSRISPDALRDLLLSAWRFVSAREPMRRSPATPRSMRRSRRTRSG